MDLLELPVDILEIISAFQDDPTLVSLSHVCLHFKEILQQKLLTIDKHSVLYSCWFHEYIDLMKSLRNFGYQWNKDKSIMHSICNNSAENKNYDLLKCLHECGCDWDSQVLSTLTKHRNLDMLKWCVDRGCSLTNRISNVAAFKGYVEILDWIINYHSEYLSDDIAYESSFEGHINILQYIIYKRSSLINQGKIGFNLFAKIERLFRDVRICTRAASNGYIEYVFYAIDNGFASNYYMVTPYIKSRIDYLIIYLNENPDKIFSVGTFMGIIDDECYIMLVERGYLPSISVYECAETLGYEV